MTTTTATTRFTGKCEACVYPLVWELPEEARDYLKDACPGCGHPVRLERLYGTFTDMNCDSSCQSAIGPLCECACGGANHSRGYIPLVPRGEVTASALSAYRRRVANIEAGAAKRSESRKAAKAEAQARADVERAFRVAEWAAEHPAEYAWLTDNKASDSFAASLSEFLNKYGELSERQLDSVTRNVERAAARAAEAALPTAPAPRGLTTFTGKILSVKDQDGYAYNTIQWKMLVRSEAGYKVWVSVPQSLQDSFSQALRASHVDVVREDCSSLRSYLVGATVTLTADIEPSSSDPTFSFGKRPRKASLIS